MQSFTLNELENYFYEIIDSVFNDNINELLDENINEGIKIFPQFTKNHSSYIYDKIKENIYNNFNEVMNNENIYMI